ncbi:MAG: hypothetical protein NTZ33_14555 [Bacteroidetes bacterium]|nr:hypothetical protein [Bacteroidota bacterium]
MKKLLFLLLFIPLFCNAQLTTTLIKDSYFYKSVIDNTVWEDKIYSNEIITVLSHEPGYYKIVHKSDTGYIEDNNVNITNDLIKQFNFSLELEKKKSDSIENLNKIIDSLNIVRFKNKFKQNISKKLPIYLHEAEIYINDEEYKENSISLYVFNLNKDETIDAVTVDIKCYNSFGEPVKYLGSNIFKGIAQDLIIIPIFWGKTIEEMIKNLDVISWELKGFKQCRSALIHVKKIHFSDGSVYTNNDPSLLNIKAKVKN